MSLWHKQTLEYAHTDTHKKRVSVTMGIIAEALRVAKNPYVSISGGKDSNVLHGLIPEQYRRIHHDDEFCLSETKKYLDSIPNLITLRTQATHMDWFVTNEGCNDLAELDFDLCFLGLRADENSYRRKHLAKFGTLYQAKSGKWFCNPIAWWKTADVWAYLISNNVQYNRAYDVMREKGIPEKGQRIGPFANYRAVQYGQLANLKKCFPSDFNLFCAKYPQARAYV